MEINAPWLTCRMGKKVYLLAKDEKAYYLIEVGKNLDYATEEWLEQQGVSEELLKELRLSFTYIPRSNLRGVAITGNYAGEFVYLYLKSEKKKVMLELDYDPDWMDNFFAGIHRNTAPKTKEKGGKGWRKDLQDKELFHKLRFVSPGFLITGAALSIGYVVTRNWILFTLSVLCAVIQFGLAVAMPVYFTIYLPRGKKKQNVWNLELPLTVVLLILFLRSRFTWMSYEALWYILPVGAILGLIIYGFVVDLKQEKGGLFSSVVLGSFVAVILAGQINEVYDFTPPESYVLEVEDLRYSSGKNPRYICTVILPDGREVEATISIQLYRGLEKGDRVNVIHDTGALGIAYVRVISEA